MKASLSMINQELPREIKIAKGYDSLPQFAEKLKLSDYTELTQMYQGTLKTYPCRFLLRKIADNSEGNVTITRLYNICGYDERDAEEDLNWTNFKPTRGSIYMADFGIGEYGIQGGIRPAYIVSNNMCNNNSSAISVIPITTKIKRNLPTHAILTTKEGMLEDSVVICEQITTISKRRFMYNGYIKYIDRVPEYKEIEIENALKKQLGMMELRYNEAIAFEMIEKILELKHIRKIRNTKTVIDMINEKLDEFENYCKQYDRNKSEVYTEYKRLIKQEELCLA